MTYDETIAVSGASTDPAVAVHSPSKQISLHPEPAWSVACPTGRVAAAGLTLAAGLAIAPVGLPPPSRRGGQDRPHAGRRPPGPGGQDIALKTAGVAKDLTFRVKKEEKDRSFACDASTGGPNADAVLFDQAVDHAVTKELVCDPKNSHGSPLAVWS